MFFRRSSYRLLGISISGWVEIKPKIRLLSGFKAIIFARGCLHAELIFTTFHSILASIKLPARSPGLTA